MTFSTLKKSVMIAVLAFAPMACTDDTDRSNTGTGYGSPDASTSTGVAPDTGVAEPGVATDTGTSSTSNMMGDQDALSSDTADNMNRTPASVPSEEDSTSGSNIDSGTGTSDSPGSATDTGTDTDSGSGF